MITNIFERYMVEVCDWLIQYDPSMRAPQQGRFRGHPRPAEARPPITRIPTRMVIETTTKTFWK